MSFRRKTYDGDFLGGSFGDRERRDPFGDKIAPDKHASAKRTSKINESSDSIDSPFSDSGDKDRYMITYADLITLLLGLFIILYAISNVDVQKFEKVKSVMGNVFGTGGKIYGIKNQNTNGIIPDAVDPNAKLMSELSGLTKDNNYGNYMRMEENERGITIHIMDELLFKSGDAELSKSSMGMLDKLAVILKKLPNDLRIEGHTDNIPISSSSFPSNWHLSVARALNTAYFLIQNKNLPADKVSIVGYSEYRPIASNGTPVGRSTNRRVDIVILKK